MSQTQSQISNPKVQISNLQSPRIVVNKSKRTLELFDTGELIKTSKIVLGFTPVGGKRAEGDGRTPEGEYYIFTKNAKSKYHLSLAVSYPGVVDAKRGLAKGLISRLEHDEIVKAIDVRGKPPQNTALGGEIYIHGGGTDDDWTDGCVAVTDEDIEEIFHAVFVGTRVTIVP